MPRELGLLGAASLELEEVRRGGERDRGVPQQPGVVAAGNSRQHRPEDADTVDVDGWCADVVADGVHTGVVAGAQRKSCSSLSAASAR